MARDCLLYLIATALVAIVAISSLRPGPRPSLAMPNKLTPIVHDRAEFKFAERRRATASYPPPAPAPIGLLRTAAKSYIPDLSLPTTFETAGKNPCWRDNSGEARCLPAFFLLGVYQSASHDLYSRLTHHPLVARNPAPSPSFYSEVHPWMDYMRKLSGATKNAHGTDKFIGECSAVTFHFTWVHQEQFNQGYVKSMGQFWKECMGRTDQEKKELPHRECMSRRMPDARAADLANAKKAGLDEPMLVPQLVRAVYGDDPSRQPALIVMLRLPWARMHAAYWNYRQYASRYGASAAGERSWANESVHAFRRCERQFSTDDCALRFESLARDNEEVFYHCDQLIKGMYSVFLPAWRKEHKRMLFLRTEQYIAETQSTLLRAMEFIGLPPPESEEAWQPLLNAHITIHGQRPKEGTPKMEVDTREQLKAFYRPSLRKLVKQLSDVEDADAWRAWSGVDDADDDSYSYGTVRMMKEGAAGT